MNPTEINWPIGLAADLAADLAEATVPTTQRSDLSPAQRIAEAWAVLDGVPDPEVPAVSVRDLGIVRDVRLAEDAQTLEVVLTPTYSGCPATEAIERNVLRAVAAAGLGPVRARLQRAPAWTTDWISEAGRRKLRAYGIAPPAHLGEAAGPAEATIRIVRHRPEATPALECPRCNSMQTERLSAFGSTACKALYRCLACGEPFEHFKPI